MYEPIFEPKDTDTFKILSEKKYLDTGTFWKMYLDTDTFKTLSEKVSKYRYLLKKYLDTRYSF